MATDIKLVDYLGFIAPDASLSNFEFKQEYSRDGHKITEEKKKLILDIVFDDSTGGMKRPRLSKPETYLPKANVCQNDNQDYNKEYKFVHFTTTDENGAHKYITLILFHLEDVNKRISNCDEEPFGGQNNEFDSSIQTPF